jgi:hypothetical protein
VIFDDDGNIWIRQSWLDTAMRCNERGRLAVVKAEWDSKSSDSAIIGTGAHKGIEEYLDLIDTPEAMRLTCAIAAIEKSIDAELELGVKWTKYDTRKELLDNANRCFDAWVDHILPYMQSTGLTIGARTEVEFAVVLYTLQDGRTVGVKGTIDFVPNAPVLWDWKTSSQKFRVKEKQKLAIQPTIYSLAAVKGGLDSDEHPHVDYRWPMYFTYGVMVRGATKSTPQILTVKRTEEHALFAIDRIKRFVDMALNYGLDKPWPQDDDHFLCSATWCPWWVLCKGAHLIDDSLPPGAERL